MNYEAIINMLGVILAMEGGLLALPMVVAISYGEECFASFLLTIGIVELVAALLRRVRPRKKEIYSIEGFVIVGLSWIVLSLFGALPFVFSGEIPSFVDAFFETVSGFTTTGSSILLSPQDMSRGLLFWRSFTHWIGGMGILVFAMVVMPMTHDRSMFVMRAEVPGPQVSKLVPRARGTAGTLYGIYAAMTLLQVGFLYLGGMPTFDCFISAFGTAGTGGFSNLNASIAGYNSPYAEMVIAVFMMLFGINFNLYFFLLQRNWRGFIRNEELRWYLGIIAGTTLIIAISLLTSGRYTNIADSLRYAFFQVSSIITTTGFATADYEQWTTIARMTLFILMFIGACAGSTGGGLKVSRLMLVVKKVASDTVRMAHPRSVRSVHIDSKAQDVTVVHRACQFFAAYIMLIFAGALLVSLDNFDFETTFSAVVATMSNIGPGLGKVGPAGNFSQFSALSKLVMSMLMLLGRLEIFPILMLLDPTMYSHRPHAS